MFGCVVGRWRRRLALRSIVYRAVIHQFHFEDIPQTAYPRNPKFFFSTWQFDSFGCDPCITSCCLLLLLHGTFPLRRVKRFAYGGHAIMVKLRGRCILGNSYTRLKRDYLVVRTIAALDGLLSG